MKRTKVSLVDPGGNITAIVSGDCSAHERHEINKKILRSNLLIEQVLFVQNKEGVIHGEMAGGEFCANAARALGYVLAHD